MIPRGLLAVFVLSVMILAVPGRICSQTFDRLIDEDADIGEILNDIPPIDLDSARTDEFAVLPAFTISGAVLVSAYRDSIGTLTLPDGSAVIVPGLSAMQQAVLDQLAILAMTSSFPVITGSLRSGAVHRPYDQEVPDSRYYLRLAAEPARSLRLTVIGERDQFEPRAMDHVSVSAAWRPIDGGLLVVGDYRPSFGQRLLFSRYSRNYLDGTETFLSNPSAIENTSFEEALFLRGGYLSVTRGRVRIDAFTSRRSLDATLDTEGGALTIRTSGLHGDGDPRGNLSETVHAAGITAGGDGPWHLGIMGAITSYDPPLARDDSERSWFNPEGERFSYMSLAGDVTAADARIYAEHVVMDGGEHATAAGVETGRDRLRASVALRDYSTGYFSLRSAGIHSFGGTENERGIYAAFEGSLPNKMSLAASYDIARTISRTYTASLPGTRRRLNLSASYPFHRSITGSCSFRSVDDIDTGSRRRSMSLTADRPFRASQGFGWRTTIALSGDDGDTGLYGEWRIVWLMCRIRSTIAVAGFDIPGYSARYYRSEPDVPGRGMSRPVWGRGGSAAMVLRGGPFAVRYRYVRSDLSGTDHELTVQSDIRF